MDHTVRTNRPQRRNNQHPLGVYFKIWILLFVLSAMSYAVDYYQIRAICAGS